MLPLSGCDFGCENLWSVLFVRGFLNAGVRQTTKAKFDAAVHRCLHVIAEKKFVLVLILPFCYAGKLFFYFWGKDMNSAVKF